MICVRTKICSLQNLPGLNPACSCLSILSIEVLSMEVFVFSFVLKYKLKLRIFRRTSHSSCCRCSCEIGAMSFVFVVVYRPDPASAVTDAFFVDWADVLERTSAFAGCTIVGDVNLHVSDVTITSSVRFNSLLDCFNLCDHVCQPTRAGSQLDILVCRSDLPVPICQS